MQIGSCRDKFCNKLDSGIVILAQSRRETEEKINSRDGLFRPQYSFLVAGGALSNSSFHLLPIKIFVLNYFWWTSSFCSFKTVHHPTTCCFSISNASQPSDLPLAWGVTNLFQPSPCCYIVAATKLLLHPTKTHFLRPAVPTTPSHLIHSRATLSVTISTDCVYSQLSHTLHSGLTLAP